MRPNLALRVVPASIGAHAASAGHFTVMEFPEYKPVAYLDSETSSLFLEEAEKDTLVWRKSSYRSTGDACVEVAPLGESAAVRDSKAADSPTLTFPTSQWRRYLGTLS